MLVAACGAAPAAPDEPAAEAPPPQALLEQPAAVGDVDIEALVRDQFRAAVDVFHGFDPDFPEPELFLLDTDASIGAAAESCGALLGPGDAFYCPPENRVYLDLGWLEDFTRRSVDGRKRDGGVFSTVAHELGHAWFEHRGYRERERVLEEELFADCLAGAVIDGSYDDEAERDRLIADAAEFAFSVGDFAFDSAGHHGTPKQRRAAMSLGAERGFGACEQYVD